MMKMVCRVLVLEKSVLTLSMFITRLGAGREISRCRLLGRVIAEPWMR